MEMSRLLELIGWAVGPAVVWGLSLIGLAWAGESVDFQREIRPILAGRCYRCHGPDESSREADLRLDRRDHATRELDSGMAAIVPGNASASELYVRVSSNDPDMRMPPEDEGEPLDDEEVTAVRRWIEQGAPFARHWSLEGPRRPSLPVVNRSAWIRNPIDAFVLRRLEDAGLEPSPEASRKFLIRRLSLDLRGLPPEPSEVREFLADQRPDAYERLVDRFLADPAYGERWARVWLDLARYADSRGYGSDPLRPNIWPYRDWLIDALNANLPFDQFTIEQLAGDLLPEPTPQQLVATAFHRNTMTNTEGGTDDEEFRVAAVKDRAETTFRVWMGLSFQCANCHDHKYDPIRQQDYYAVYAIFNQTADSDRPDEFPTMEVPVPELVARRQRIDEQIAERQKQLKSLKDKVAAERTASPVEPIQARYVRVEIPGQRQWLALAEVQVFQGDENVARRAKASQSSTAYDAPANLAIDGNTDGHFFNARSTTHTDRELGPWWEADLGETYAVDRVVVWNRTDGDVGNRLDHFRVSLLDEQRKTVWSVGDQSPPEPSTRFVMSGAHPLEEQIAKLEREMTALEKSKPALPRVPVMKELPEDERRTTRLMLRGNFLTPGDPVEPAFPDQLFRPKTEYPPDRLGLAKWLIDPENPLTARVAVNRLWGRLFGTAIVETEEDFGTQGELPSHPELLDWLAVEYRESGWDTKGLLRLIVTSATYRQSSVATLERLERDPRNRLLSRSPRYRLEAEMVRDQALALSGLLSRKMYGPSVYPYQPPGMWRAAFNGQRTWPTSSGEDRYRRALYTFWRRTVPYPSMQAFDAPSREVCTIRRVRTNTPLQAFVTLNDPVYVEAAQSLARRLVREGGDTVQDRVAYGLRLCLVRTPTPRQIDVLTKLYQQQLAYYKDRQEAATKLAGDANGEEFEAVSVAELAAWTVVSNVLLNLDGVLTRS